MKNLKIQIVVANYYKEITNPLTKSCVNILEQNNLKYEIITVPGVYEIPQMIKWKIKPNNYNLFISTIIPDPLDFIFSIEACKSFVLGLLKFIIMSSKP